MFKKKDDEKKVEEEAPRDEHAYEDSWYRSLKALREQESGEGQGVEGPGEEVSEEPSGTSDGSPEETLTSISGHEDLDVEATAVDEATVFQPTGNGEVPEFDASDVEARAGQLLERLRAIQRRGDE